MQSEEQRLIDGLFGRLKEAETKTGQRDLQAEQQINQHIREQPSAPYYMAQAMIIQEAALKQLDQRVKDLESQVAQQQQNSANPPSSGGFLAGLFGGGNRSTPSPREQYQAQQQNNAAWNNQPQPGYAPQQQQSTSAGDTFTRRRVPRWGIADRSRRGGRCGAGRYADRHVPPFAAARDCEYHRRDSSGTGG